MVGGAQVGKVGPRLETPGAITVNGEHAALAAGDGGGEVGGVVAGRRVRHTAGGLAGGIGPGGADAEAAAVRVTVVTQQVGVDGDGGVGAAYVDGGAGAGGAVGHAAALVFGGGAIVRQDGGGVIAAGDGDGKAGDAGAALAVGDGVADAGGGALADLELVEVSAGVKAPGAVGMEGELAAVAAGQQPPDVGGAEGIGIDAHLADSEAVTIRVPVVTQQVGVDGDGAAVIVGIYSASAFIKHRQGGVFPGAAQAIDHRGGIIGAVDDDGEGGGAAGLAVSRQIADCGGGALAALEAFKVTAGVELPAAVRIEGEAAAAAAGAGVRVDDHRHRHRLAHIRRRQAGDIGADGADGEAAVYIFIVQQQVRIDGDGSGCAVDDVAGAAAGIAGADAEELVFTGLASVIPDGRGVVLTGDLHHQAADAAGARAIIHHENDLGIAGCADRQVVKILARVEAPGAVQIDGKAAAIAAGGGLAQVVRVEGGGGEAHRVDGPGAGAGGLVVQQQAGVGGDAGGGAVYGQAGGVARLRAGDDKRGIFRGGAAVGGDGGGGHFLKAGDGDREFAHIRQGFAVGAAVVVGHGVAHPACGRLPGPQVVEGGGRLKAPGAVAIDVEEAAAATEYPLAHQVSPQATIGGKGGAHLGDAEGLAGVAVFIVEQQVAIETIGVHRLAVADPANDVFIGAALVVHRHRGVILADHRDLEGAVSGGAAVRYPLVDGDGFLFARVQVVKPAIGVVGPGAVAVDSEFADILRPEFG